MIGYWAKHETVRGKGSVMMCAFCGKRPNILEHGLGDKTEYFSVCCAYCGNKWLRGDKLGVSISIVVHGATVYEAIRDWNKINRKVAEV